MRIKCEAAVAIAIALAIPAAGFAGAADPAGDDKWQAGLSVLVFDATNPRFQWGGLISWQTNFAGPSDAADTESLVLQPIYIFALGKGFYTGGAPIWVFDLEKTPTTCPWV